VQTIERILSAYRFRFATEAELQDGIGEALGKHGPRREVKLNARDRIDFVLWGVGIEVKIKGGISALTRQLVRYAAVEELAALVVVTSQSQYALQLPRELGGKPLAVVCVRRGIG
jgi:hypothetical protein